MVLVPIIFLLITQPDVGQTFLVLLTWLSLIFISGINLVNIFFIFWISTNSFIIFNFFYTKICLYFDKT